MGDDTTQFAGPLAVGAAGSQELAESVARATGRVLRALAQGAAQVVDVICAVRAGEDLLSGTADAELIRRLEEGLEQAERRGLTDPRARAASAGRLAAVRRWLAGFEKPSLDVEALCGALFGESPFTGRLPVEIVGLHPRGHGLTA